MSLNRRNFLKTTAGAAGAAWVGGRVFASPAQEPKKDGPIAILKPMTDGIVPISDAERLARMEKARKLMVENGIDAIAMEGGSSLIYFTDVNWWNSERTFLWILPARGEMAWVCPKFEEDRAREQIRFGSDIRTWEEDESPYRAIADVLAGRGLRTGRIGLEE